MKKLFPGMILALFLLFAPNAGAMPKYEPYCLFSGCGGLSDDGTRAIFTFDEPLDSIPGVSPGDQIYERYQGVTKGIVNFPAGKRRGVQLHAVSDDARRAIVQTRSPLAPEDTDGFGDDYFVIDDGQARLLSWDPADPGSAATAKLAYQFKRASDDARTVYFSKYMGGLGSMCLETWARTETAMTQLPLGCNGWRFSGVSRDGSSLYYEDQESAYAENIHSAGGTFRLRNGQRTLMNGFPANTGTNCTPYSDFGDATADGETMLFTANHPATAEDTDTETDVYIRHADGSYELVTNSPATPGVVGCGGREGHEPDKALGLSADGSKALFTTEYPLSPDDHDSSMDGYVFTSGGEAELVTTGPADDGSEVRNPALGDKVAGWHVQAWRMDASDDLSVVAFDSSQRLVSGDTDDSIDVYVRSNGVTSLVSTGDQGGNGSFDAKMLGISNDGSRVAFTTVESLLAVDTDDRMDIYARTLGVTERAGGATVSARKKKTKRSRTRLVSAESVAPRMKVKGPVRMRGARSAIVRLTCPKHEETGPCRGRVSLAPKSKKGSRGTGRFSVKPGKTAKVRIHLNKKPSGQWKARLRIVAADLLGNTDRRSHRIKVRS
jgi:hypothetical protein